MRKFLNKPWVVAVLGIAALLIAAQSFLFQGGGTGSPGSPPPAGRAKAPAPAGIPAAPSAPLTINDALKAVGIPEAPRDPFALYKRVEAPLHAPGEPAAVETVRLSAIWTQNGETFVLVNGKILQAGDNIGRLKIESTTQEGMWVRHWKGRNFMSLGATFTLITPVTQPATPIPQPLL